MDVKNLNYSKHVEQRIEERNIKNEWIVETIKSPDKKVEKSEDEVHFFKKIFDLAGKCLKVVVNPIKNLVVTAHFDRKMTKNDCK